MALSLSDAPEAELLDPQGLLVEFRTHVRSDGILLINVLGASAMQTDFDG